MPLKCDLRWAALLFLIRLYSSHYVSGFADVFALQITVQGMRTSKDSAVCPLVYPSEPCTTHNCILER